MNIQSPNSEPEPLAQMHPYKLKQFLSTSFKYFKAVLISSNISHKETYHIESPSFSSFLCPGTHPHQPPQSFQFIVQTFDIYHKKVLPFAVPPYICPNSHLNVPGKFDSVVSSSPSHTGHIDLSCTRILHLFPNCNDC